MFLRDGKNVRDGICTSLPSLIIAMEPEKRHALRAHMPDAATDWLSPLPLATMSASAYIENLAQNSARLGGGCWSRNYFAHFLTQSCHYIFIMISRPMNNYGETNVFPRLVSIEMAAIFDFRALTKVHITSKPLLQMQ